MKSCSRVASFETTPPGQPSFVPEIGTERGLVASNDFQLPDASHADGLTQGRLAALEYLRHMCSKDATTCRPFALIFAPRPQASRWRDQTGNSAGFLATLERMIFFAVRHSNFEADIAGSLARRATEDAKFSAAEVRRKHDLVAQR